MCGGWVWFLVLGLIFFGGGLLVALVFCTCCLFGLLFVFPVWFGCRGFFNFFWGGVGRGIVVWGGFCFGFGWLFFFNGLTVS